MKTSILAAIAYLIEKQGLRPDEVLELIIKTEQEIADGSGN